MRDQVLHLSGTACWCGSHRALIDGARLYPKGMAGSS